MKNSFKFKQATLALVLGACGVGVLAQSSDGKSTFTASVKIRDISGVSCTDLNFGIIYRIPLTLFAVTDSVTVGSSSDTDVATTTAVGATVTGGHPAVCSVTGLQTATPAKATAMLSSTNVKLINIINPAQSLDAVLTTSLLDSGAAAGTSGKFRIGGKLTLKTAGPAAGEAADGVFTSAPITITVTN